MRDGIGWSHPKPWEHEVQSGFRAERPPYRDGATVLLLGLDEAGEIGAVVLITLRPEVHAARLRGLAVAVPYRGRGGGHAREAMRVAVEWVQGQTHSNDRPYLALQGSIDKRNSASKTMCVESGWVYVEDEDDRLESWALRL